MNCKPGDLAVVVRRRYSDANVGKLVRTVRLVADILDADGPCWEVESLSGVLSHRDLKFCGLTGWFEDSRLRPIRDSDGEDETLTWAGRPEQITA